MTDEDVFDEMVEVGECGHCHETKEIAATMQVSANIGGEKLSELGSDVNLCEACIPKVMEEFAALSTGKVSVTVGLDADSDV